MSNSGSNWEERIRFQWRLKSLVVFVLSVFILSSLVGGWYRSVRSSNALDELYYATVDSTAYDAIAHGFTSPDVLLSAVSAVKDQDVRRMSGIDMWAHCNRFKYIEYSDDFLPFGSVSGMEYSFECVEPEQGGVASVYWNAEDGWSPSDRDNRGLCINISLPAANYGDRTAKGRVGATFSYDIESKCLSCDATEGRGVEHKGDQTPTGEWISGRDYIIRHNIRVERVAEDALTVIEGTLLPNFINRGGSTSTHSADIEADGVTVDIDLSALSQPEGK